MKKYKVISVDMFQTLVDVDSSIENIWKRILGESYSTEKKDEYLKMINETIIDSFYREESRSEKFRLLSEIVAEGFEKIFSKTMFDFSSEEAVKIFFQEHNNAGTFYDSNEFIRRAAKLYKVCLISDADMAMIEKQIGKFDFDKVFISEKTGAYKGSPGNELFQLVVRSYDINPERILHIGDAVTDVEGAKKAGMDVCWINRKNEEKKFRAEPDYILSSLEELSYILGI